jgi:hypothetical protein
MTAKRMCDPANLVWRKVLADKERRNASAEVDGKRMRKCLAPAMLPTSARANAFRPSLPLNQTPFQSKPGP